MRRMVPLFLAWLMCGCLRAATNDVARSTGDTVAADDFDWANLETGIVLKAIAMFAADPGGTNAAGAMAIIVNFVEASTNVEVGICAELQPWMCRKPAIKKGGTLLAAFIAGNIRPQLEKHVNQDHPAEGVVLMCEVYKTLRQRGLIQAVPELEQWSKLDRAGIDRLIPKREDYESVPFDKGGTGSGNDQ